MVFDDQSGLFVCGLGSKPWLNVAGLVSRSAALKPFARLSARQRSVFVTLEEKHGGSVSPYS